MRACMSLLARCTPPHPKPYTQHPAPCTLYGSCAGGLMESSWQEKTLDISDPPEDAPIADAPMVDEGG